jgi:hypothetical protein
MNFIRYLQLCWSLGWIMLGGGPPPRKARGDIRNFARSFYMNYNLHKLHEAGQLKGPHRD